MHIDSCAAIVQYDAPIIRTGVPGITTTTGIKLKVNFGAADS